MNNQQLCDRHMSDSDYVAKRFSDWWNVRQSPHAHTRAFYRRQYLEAYEKMQERVRECQECSLKEAV